MSIFPEQRNIPEYIVLCPEFAEGCMCTLYDAQSLQVLCVHCIMPRFYRMMYVYIVLCPVFTEGLTCTLYYAQSLQKDLCVHCIMP